MNPKLIKRYEGTPVIVQFREAMALGVQKGAMRSVPVTNLAGGFVLKDGSPAPEGTKAEDLQWRPTWNIEVRKDANNNAEFRYAIEDALVSVIEPLLTNDEEGVRVVVSYHAADGCINALVVEPDEIRAITYVQQGSMPEKQQSRIVAPGN